MFTQKLGEECFYMLIGIAKMWTQPTCPSVSKWLNILGTSIPWNTTQQLKEPVDTDNNPGKSPENYVEWKKKILKGGILYGSIYVSFLK